MKNKEYADILVGQQTGDNGNFRRSGKPAWLKVSLPTGAAYQKLKKVISDNDLHTVCESAACPNRGECWSRSTATIMILGNICTRSCSFCNVITGRPTELDLDEPRRVARAVLSMGLKYVVITSVNRDELADGGASIWAQTICSVRQSCPDTRIEVLIPDFCGNRDALQTVIEAAPDVLNHNIETHPRLYRQVRPQGKFERSLDVLKHSRSQGLITKSGFMVGLGESDDEVFELLRFLAASGVDLVTIGQYMQPTPNHIPVHRWVSPEQFEFYRVEGMKIGFQTVFSGPLVRSSYHAQEQSLAIL